MKNSREDAIDTFHIRTKNSEIGSLFQFLAIYETFLKEQPVNVI